MIDCLNQVDDSEKKTAATHEELQSLENDLLQEQQLVGVATENAGKRLNELDLERQEISSKIEADVLKLFRKVQSQQVRGNAVVPVQDAVCHGCYVNIPPQMYNELHRQDNLKLCPHCHRMIYWKQTNHNQAEADQTIAGCTIWVRRKVRTPQGRVLHNVESR